jgi:hypothetical protein
LATLSPQDTGDSASPSPGGAVPHLSSVRIDDGGAQPAQPVDSGSNSGSDNGNGNGNAATPGVPAGAMSGPAVYVDTSQLALGIPQVTALSMRLGTILGGVRGLDSLGQPWGPPGDATGDQFGPTYQAGNDQWQQAVSGMKDVTDSSSDRIGQMSRGYGSTEQDIVSAIPPLGTDDPHTKG